LILIIITPIILKSQDNVVDYNKFIELFDKKIKKHQQWCYKYEINQIPYKYVHAYIRDTIELRDRTDIYAYFSIKNFDKINDYDVLVYKAEHGAGAGNESFYISSYKNREQISTMYFGTSEDKPWVSQFRFQKNENNIGIITEHKYNFKEKYAPEEFHCFNVDKNGKISKIDCTIFEDQYRKFPEASSRILNIEDLEKYSIEDLAIMRNEVFADYGYIFKSSKWKSYFTNMDWYKPRYENVNNNLSNIEKLNVELILKVENRKIKQLEENKIVVVLDGYFTRIKKNEIREVLDDVNIVDTSFVEPDTAYKCTGLIGRNGLFLISTDLAPRERMTRFSEYFVYDRMPLYIVNGTDTISDYKGIDPNSIDSMIVIPPFDAALKFGSNYNGGIIKIYNSN